MPAADPWGEFREAPKADPWAEFAPIAKPPATTANPPGLLSRVAKGIGTLGSSAVAGAQSLGQVADPLMAAAGTAGSYLVPYTSTGSVGERFKNEMENIRRTREERYQASPNAFGAGAVLMGGAAGPALARMAPLSAGAPTGPNAAALLTRAGSGVADAALFNAASQAASNVDRDPLGAAAEAFSSPANLLGAAPALMGPAADVLRATGRGVGRAATALLPKTAPTEAALRLRAEGVPLTLGQNNPDSFYAAFEQASADSPLGMHLEQGAAKDANRAMLQGQTRAPGAAALTSPTTQGRWAEILGGFESAYAPLRDTPIPAEAVAGLPEAALRLPGGIPDTARAGVMREVKDALSTLSKRAPMNAPSEHAYDPQVSTRGRSGYDPAALVPDAVSTPEDVSAYRAAMEERWKPATPETREQKPYSAGDLLNVRKYIREEIRGARQGTQPSDVARLKALEHAEDAVTATLEEHMSPEAADSLRAIDRQYAKTMTLMGASPAGKTEFTTDQAARAVEQSMGRRAFKTGAAGDLQDLIQAGQRTFDQRVKPTGMRSAILSVMPAKFAGAGARFLNQPETMAQLLGEQYRPPPSPATAGPPLTEAQARALALAQVLRRNGPALPPDQPFGLGPVPTMASEDDRR